MLQVALGRETSVVPGHQGNQVRILIQHFYSQLSRCCPILGQRLALCAGVPPRAFVLFALCLHTRRVCSTDLHDSSRMQPWVCSALCRYPSANPSRGCFHKTSMSIPVHGFHLTGLKDLLTGFRRGSFQLDFIF